MYKKSHALFLVPKMYQNKISMYIYMYWYMKQIIVKEIIMCKYNQSLKNLSAQKMCVLIHVLILNCMSTCTHSLSFIDLIVHLIMYLYTGQCLMYSDPSSGHSNT